LHNFYTVYKFRDLPFTHREKHESDLFAQLCARGNESKILNLAFKLNLQFVDVYFEN
jgi:hypothetical protein